MSSTTTRFLTSEEYPKWDAFVEKSSSGSVYSTARYLAALCAATHSTFRILAAYRGSELFGGIALYETASRWGSAVSNRLLLYYNGFVLRDSLSKYPAERTSEQQATLKALVEALEQGAWGRIILHHRSPVQDLRVLQVHGWFVTPTYSYVVPLTNLTQQFELVDKNLRRLIRRAEDEHLVVTEDEDFDSFFKLHEEVHQRKEAPLYLPRPVFQKYFEQLRREQLATLYQVRQTDGRAIAAQLVLLGNHRICHTVCAGSHPDGLKNGASAFLRWKAFESLAARGYQGNDLTDAALNPVTKFKSELGGNLELTLVSTSPERGAFRVASTFERLRSIARSVCGK